MAYYFPVGTWVKIHYRRKEVAEEQLPYGRVCTIKKTWNRYWRPGMPKYTTRYTVEFLDRGKYRTAQYYRSGLEQYEPTQEEFALWAINKLKSM